MNHELLLQQSLEAPVCQFLEHPSKKPFKYVSFRYENPVSPDYLSIEPARVFPLFEMFNLKSLGIIYGYFFSMDGKVVKVRDKYFTIIRPSVVKMSQYSGVEMVYQSNYLNISSSPDGAALIYQNKLSEVINVDMIRRSKKAGRYK